MFLTYIDMNQPWVYMCSPSWTPPPTSHPIPSLWVIPVHQPWAPCLMHQNWTGNLFHIRITYMFQCYSFRSYHPCFLPQSPKVCYLHLCLFCYLANKIVVTVLNSIYMCISILYWCFSFWLTSLCIIGSRFIHLITTDSNVFFLMAE